MPSQFAVRSIMSGRIEAASSASDATIHSAQYSSASRRRRTSSSTSSRNPMLPMMATIWTRLVMD
jgi:hypothetical protein